MPVLFSKPRYVPRKSVIFKGKPIPKGFIYKAKEVVVTVGVPMVEEQVPGPTPIFIPWIICNPTSISYYVW